MNLSPEVVEMLNEMSKKRIALFFAPPLRNVFDSIITPMNVWKKQFTSPEIKLTIRIPMRLVRHEGPIIVNG